jgi:hypothetical protein
MTVKRAMTDKPAGERGKGQLYRKAVENVVGVLPTRSARHARPSRQADPAEAAPPEAAEPPAPPQDALEVLTLAQRTAEDYIAAVNEQTEAIRSEAQAVAEQIEHDARAYADKIRADADELLAQARATAELSSRDADATATEVQRHVEAVLADARTEADRIVADGRGEAEQVELRARHRYEDAVGGLSAECMALQKQIEALTAFDTEYRLRISSYLHSQLGSL